MHLGVLLFYMYGLSILLFYLYSMEFVEMLESVILCLVLILASIFNYFLIPCAISLSHFWGSPITWILEAFLFTTDHKYFSQIFHFFPLRGLVVFILLTQLQVICFSSLMSSLLLRGSHNLISDSIFTLLLF